jgi:hypothetical protein
VFRFQVRQAPIGYDVWDATVAGWYSGWDLTEVEAREQATELDVQQAFQTDRGPGDVRRHELPRLVEVQPGVAAGRCARRVAARRRPVVGPGARRRWRLPLVPRHRAPAGKHTPRPLTKAAWPARPEARTGRRRFARLNASPRATGIRRWPDTSHLGTGTSTLAAISMDVLGGVSVCTSNVALLSGDNSHAAAVGGKCSNGGRSRSEPGGAGLGCAGGRSAR